MNRAFVVQYGKVVGSFDAGEVTEITPKIYAQGEDLADSLIKQGIMQGGYYDLELRNNGKLVDSEILIA